MKVVTARLVRFLDYGPKPPTHGVYSLAGWELEGEKAYPISLHWNYQAAVDSAARGELAGHTRVLVCFNNSIANVGGLGRREKFAGKADFEWDDAPHYEPEF